MVQAPKSRPISLRMLRIFTDEAKISGHGQKGLQVGAGEAFKPAPKKIRHIDVFFLSGRRFMILALLAPLREDLRAFLSTLRAIPLETWVIAALCLAAFWLWGFVAQYMPPAIFPSPAETAEAFFYMIADRRRDYITALGQSLGLYLSGLTAAGGLGAGLIWIMGAKPFWGRVLSPILDTLSAVPNIALMPLFVALLGLGAEAKLAVIFLAALFPIVVNGYAALRQIDPDYAEAAISLGASPLRAWRVVVWPLARPALVAGLRIGAAQALTACVISEIYTAMTGLGGLLSGYGSAFNMPRYFVVVITLGVIGVTLSSLLRRLEHHLRRGLH